MQERVRTHLIKRHGKWQNKGGVYLHMVKDIDTKAEVSRRMAGR